MSAEILPSILSVKPLKNLKVPLFGTSNEYPQHILNANEKASSILGIHISYPGRTHSECHWMCLKRNNNIYDLAVGSEKFLRY